MSNSWKLYGGQSTLDSLNNITVNSLVTDFFSLRKYYVGDWDICGGLRVKDNAVIYGSQDICANLIVGENISVIGEFTGLNDANFYGNLVIEKDLYLGGVAYFDICANTLLSAINGGFGFNKYNPNAIIDISSDRVQTIFMQTSTTENNNIYAQNAGQQGITLGVDLSSAYINFYVDSSMNGGNNDSDANITYSKNGYMAIDVSNVLNMRPRMVLASDLDKVPYSDLDRITVYDTNTLAKSYMNYVYEDTRLRTGIGLTTVSQDNSSNIFLRMISPEGKGALVGGGPFEGGQMASIGIIDASVNNFSDYYLPGLQIFSGDIIKNLKTTTTINKHRASKSDDGLTNRYALDVNGPVKLIHQELLLGLDISLVFNYVSFAPNSSVGYAVGSPINDNVIYQRFICKTIDGGYTWTPIRLILTNSGFPDNDFEQNTNQLNVVFAYSDTEIYIGGGGGYLYKSINGGISWSKINFLNGSSNFNINDIFADASGVILGLNTGQYIFINGAFTTSIDLATNIFSSSLTSITAVYGKNNNYILAGAGGIQSYIVGTGMGTRYENSSIFNDVRFVYESGQYHAVAVGNGGLIRYLHNSSLGASWSTPITYNFAWNINAVHVFGADKAIAVGSNGLIIYSVDSNFSIWNQITAGELNAMGNGNLISNHNLSEIFVIDSSHFIISAVYQSWTPTQQGRSKLFNFYAPYFFNRATNYVLEASGSVLLSGDLRINDNGNVFTNSSSISLFPDTATTINMGNTAIGGNTFIRHNLEVIGNTHINQKLQVDSYSFLNADVSINAKMYLTGDASMNSNLFVGKDVSLGQKLYVVGDVSMNSNLFVGKDVSLGQKLYVVGDVSMNSKLFAGSDVSFSEKLYTRSDVSFDSNLFVGLDLSVGSRLRVAGKSQFESDVSINANLFVVDVSLQNLQIRGTTNSTGVGVGSLLSAGGASFAKSVNIGGNLFVNNFVDSVAGTSSLFIGNSNAATINVGVTDATSVINIGKSIGTGRGTNVDIYLGDSVSNSTVHILGNLLVPGSIIYENQTELQVKNKTILLNDEAAAGTSAGAGLYIRDNGSDTAGSILVNANRTGFTFKATNGSNMVNLDTENLVLPGGLDKGILTIVPTTNGDGSQFTIARTVVDISNIYLLDVCLNSRLIRNNAATLTQTNTQIVDTKMVSSGFFVGKTEATMISNTQIDVSGNTVLSRLGINTVAVNTGYTLDISGNTFTNGRIVQW
jgi:hypothetical protein